MTPARASLLVVGVVLAALVGVAVGSAGQGTTWVPQALSSDPASVGATSVNRRGDAVVVFDTGGFLRGLTRRAGASWQTLRGVAGGDGRWFTAPAAGIDGRGNVVVAWNEASGGAGYVIYGAAAPAGQGLGSPQRVSGIGVDRPRLVMNERGDAAVVWVRGGSGPEEGVIEASFRPARGRFGPVALLGQGASPGLALDARGNTDVVWVSDGGVRTARRPVGSRFGASTSISAERGSASDPVIAVDALGRAVVLWTDDGGIACAFRPAGGRFGAPERVSSDGFATDVALDPSGNAIAVWERWPSVGPWAAIRSISTGWQPPTLLAQSPGALAPQVGLDAEGDAVIVWAQEGAVHASTRPAGGTFAPSQQITIPGARALAPDVAVDEAGDALLVWNEFVTGSDHTLTLHAVALDAAGPQLRSLRVPATTPRGVPLRLSVSPVDVWSKVVATRWRFGDGTTASGPRVTHVYRRPGRFTVTVTSVDTLGQTTTAVRTVRITEVPR
jgi:PKD domain